MFKRTIIVLLLLQGSILATALSNTSTAQAVSMQDPSWSDDFEGGNFDGWTTYGALEGNKLPGNFTITDGALIARGINWNLAIHDSSVAYGTWSFDVYPVDREHNELLVSFILENHTVTEWWINGYMVQFVTGPYRGYTEPMITLLRQVRWGVDVVWIGEAPTGNLTGWQHIDVTRDRSGHICVYLNGSLYLTAVDRLITSSTLFCFAGESGQGIDNVTVTSEVIMIDEATPIWFPEAPPDKTVERDQPLRYDLNATDPSGLDTWWLNDTARFEVDDEGVVTNRTSLDIGQYGVHVWVNDTLGYTLEGMFKVIVTETPPEDGDTTLPLDLIAVGVVASVTIIAIVIIVQRRRAGV
ncbi:MAG: hypothetical protein ACW99U_09720 [Candidatus Thorarchaeota archaeon]